MFHDFILDEILTECGMTKDEAAPGLFEACDLMSQLCEELDVRGLAYGYADGVLSLDVLVNKARFGKESIIRAVADKAEAMVIESIPDSVFGDVELLQSISGKEWKPVTSLSFEFRIAA